MNDQMFVDRRPNEVVYWEHELNSISNDYNNLSKQLWKAQGKGNTVEIKRLKKLFKELDKNLEKLKEIIEKPKRNIVHLWLKPKQKDNSGIKILMCFRQLAKVGPVEQIGVKMMRNGDHKLN